ncbi:hypothetical protein [Francisella sciaenopsi]|uniref:hypothetical protein n=1 Tax=Francisella sciaenopsi TaxID=3055034 RepID=UPI0038B381B4
MKTANETFCSEDDLAVLKIVNFSYKTKELLYEYMSLAMTLPINSVTVLVLRLIKYNWYGNVLSFNDADELLAAVEKVKLHPNMKNHYFSFLNQFIAICNRVSFMDHIHQILDLQLDDDLRNIRVLNRINICKHSINKKVLKRLNKSFERNLNSLDTLKLDFFYRNKYKSPELVMKHLCNSLSHNCTLSEELSHISNMYKYLRINLKYYDILINSETLNDLASLIVEKLNSLQSFSLIRLNDGEAYAVSDMIYDLEFRNNRERHWWGESISYADSTEIIKKIQASVNNADVVGIPSYYAFLRETTLSMKSLMTSGYSTKLNIKVLEYMLLQYRLGTFGGVFTDSMLVNVLEAMLEKIIPTAKRLIIISPYGGEDMNLIFGCYSKDIISITICGHQRDGLSDNTNNILPLSYNEIIYKIESVVRRGDLVLVSAGVIGKIFVDSAKNKGSVAIDTGSYIGRMLEELNSLDFKFINMVNCFDREVIYHRDSIELITKKEEGVLYAFNLYSNKVLLQKQSWNRNSKCIFKLNELEGQYTARFYYRREHIDKLIKFVDVNFKIYTKKVLEYIGKKSHNESSNDQSKPTAVLVQSNKLLLDQLTQKDNDLIDFVSEISKKDSKINKLEQQVELKSKEVAALEKSIIQSANQILSKGVKSTRRVKKDSKKSVDVKELIQRNLLVQSHLDNVQKSLIEKTNMLYELKSEFDKLKSMLSR